MRFAAVLLGALTAGLFAVPSSYQIPGCAAGFTPAIDGNLSEWSDTYFIDSLRSDDNIFCRDNTFPWTRADFQYKVFAAHDDAKVYFSLQLLADEGFQTGSSGGCDDGWKINPGGKATAFYLMHNGTVIVNPSCPFALGSTLFATIIPTPNQPNCTAEFSLDKMVLDPFGMGTFQLCVGMEEGDTPDCMDTHYGGIGVEYLGNKQDWNSNPWDNPMYYPTFSLQAPKVESRVAARAVETLAASPNPFTPATTLCYNIKNSGSLKIYDMAGKVVESFAVMAGAGSVEWNADGMASGIYVARLISGKSTLNTRLFLTR